MKRRTAGSSSWRRARTWIRPLATTDLVAAGHAGRPATLSVPFRQESESAKNPKAAKHAAQAIRSGVQLLVRHPQSGRPVERMEPEFREQLIAFGRDGYVALYRLDGDAVVVLAIRHGREAGY